MSTETPTHVPDPQIPAPATVDPEEPLPSLLDDPQVRRWGPVVGLVLLAFIFLFPGIRGMYIWDDPGWLTRNATVKAGVHGLWQIWTDPRATPHYYPLVFTTFWLEFHQWGLGAKGPDGIIRGVGYHIDNLLLHIASVLILFRLLRKLKLPGGAAGAWLAAAIWAIHPMNVESVAWVAERKNMLSGVFFFASMYCGLAFYNVIEREPVEGAAAKPGPRWGMYAATVLLFLCALLSKTAACFVPPALLVMIWWKRGKITLREIAYSLPMFVLAIGLGAVTAILERDTAGATGKEFAFSFLQRVVIAGDSVCFYIGKLFWPDPVMQIYPRFDIVAAGAGGKVGNPILYLGPVAAVLIALALWALRKKITRGPLAAYLIFVGGLFPVMGFINYYTMVYTFVADHYQYLAGVPIIVLAVETGLWALRKVADLRSQPQGGLIKPGVRLAAGPDEEQLRFLRVAGSLLFGGLVLSLGVLSFGAASLYQDSQLLWVYNAKWNTSPGAFGVWNNLGDSLRDDYGNDAAAEKAFTQALTFQPNWQSYQALGQLALKADKVDEARNDLAHADALMPPFVAARRAQQIREKALAFDAGLGQGNPLQYSSSALIGLHQMDMERWDDALQCFQDDRKRLGDNPLDDYYIAQALGGKENYIAGIDWFNKALALNDRFPDAWLRLGIFLRYTGHEQDAEKALWRAYQLDPRNLAWLPPLIQPTLDKKDLPGLPSFVPAQEGGMVGPPVPLNLLTGNGKGAASQPAAGPATQPGH
ncbi:MAG TPA: tetratricopeptide repeat protein [Phycisphaerae bacterium]|nr:tetratricopeptide repeat protein [Phycisphaerae bacterium]